MLRVNGTIIGGGLGWGMTTIASQGVQMQAGALSQSIGTAVARQQIDAQKAVAAMIAETAASASPPAPAGQGQLVDLKV